MVPSSAWVASDRALLASVLRNLVSNAIRYTESGGVVVGARRSGGDILLSVVDTGPGIAAQDRDRIFEEFQRVAGDKEGLGLGLAIVRRTAALLELPITIETIEGRGSSFAVRIPVLRWGAKPRRLRTGQPGALPGTARIAVVDNDPSALAATTALLGKWQLEVGAATDLPSLLEAFPHAPDVAIMDYRLDDGATGDAVFEQACRHWGQRPPAILLTAEAGAETEQAARRMGAHRLLKPSSPAALRALMADAIARAKRGEDQVGAASTTG